MKQFVFGDSEAQSVLTVEHDGTYHDPDEGFPRPVYRYTITTDKWTYTNADIQGDQNEEPNEEFAAQSVFYFLFQCVKEENSEFPVNVRAWASRYVDEIEELATGIEGDNPAMAMIDGVLVEADEESTQF